MANRKNSWIPRLEGVALGLILALLINVGLDIAESIEANAGESATEEVTTAGEGLSVDVIEDAKIVGDGYSKFHDYDGIVMGNEVLTLGSDQWVAIRFMEAPLTVRLTRDGNKECYADDNGDCGDEGDVLSLDAMGQRVWQPIPGAAAP